MPVSASPGICFCALRVRRRALNLPSDPFARPSIAFSRRFFPFAKACRACAVCAFALVSILTNPPCSAPGGTTVCTVWINSPSRQSMDEKVGPVSQPGGSVVVVVAGAVPPSSYAPISHVAIPSPLPSTGRGKPRWSVAGGGAVVVRDGDVGQACDSRDVVVADPPPAGTRRVSAHVSAHCDVGQRDRERILDAPAGEVGRIAAYGRAGQGEVIDARDAAP